MPFADDLRKMILEAKVPADLKERLEMAIIALPANTGCNWPGLEVPVTAEEVASAIGALYAAAPYYHGEPPTGIVFNDTGQDFSCSLRQEVGRLFPVLMKDFSAHQRASVLSQHIGPQFVMRLKVRLIHDLQEIDSIALAAARNVWSLVYLTLASLFQDWPPGVQAALPLLELSPRAIPLSLYRKGGLWMVLRLTA